MASRDPAGTTALQDSPLLSWTPERLDDPTLEEFRIAQPLELQTLLGRMAEQGAVLGLSVDEDELAWNSIVEVDRTRRLLWLAGAHGEAGLHRLVSAASVTAVGYLDRVKVQFSVQNLKWLPARDGSRRLACMLPVELYRIQRRAHFRARPVPPVPLVHIASAPGRERSFEVIDISMTGIGLHLPPDEAPLDVGACFAGAVVTLAPRLHLEAKLEVMHITPSGERGRGHHMGCAIDGLVAEAVRTLQRFIGQVELRRNGRWE
ncbi:Flagellar brake protein YcgR [Pigmentiphaga humi]|uniref:Flagellar brake protein YcgR n=1 Tax=Pigmentiphaga humi TaxID=2478468 RepID=A0A3P4AX81_9BURK|nr:flagellar brake protein [Pigmentiphaga humi]VCU67990.1 Flagellar brake protein YcgR [Pigmentiphaga humi]